jgi:rubrerythrin
MDFASIEDVLDYAIEREKEAHALYTELADRVTRPGMREVLLEFAQVEDGHRQQLERVRSGELPELSAEMVQSLRIADHLDMPEPTAHMTYREALLFAVKAENASYTLYNRLADLTDDAELVEVFRSLAREEASHKLQFEKEYEVGRKAST